MSIRGLLTSCIKMPLYTSLQAFKGFNKVHNSHSINNNLSTYKLLTCILLVQRNYTNMAFSSHLQGSNNQGTLNHSMVLHIHLQASNSQGTLNHSMVLTSHLQGRTKLGTLNYSMALTINLQASNTQANNLGMLNHSIAFSSHLKVTEVGGRYGVIRQVVFTHL